jgi:hypothetical protein
MHQHPRAFDMAQELMAQANALARAFYEAGDVDHHECLIVMIDHAKRGFERCERVVGYFGARRAYGREQARLASVRLPYNANVGKQLQLQPQTHLLTRFTRFGKKWKAVGRGRESSIAPASRAAVRYQDTLAGLAKVSKQSRWRFFRPNLCADWHNDIHVIAVLAMTLRALSVPAVPGDKAARVSERQQGVDVFVGNKVDVPAASSVSPVRPAPWDELLAASAYITVSAFAANYVDKYLVYHFSGIIIYSHNRVDSGDNRPRRAGYTSIVARMARGLSGDNIGITQRAMFVTFQDMSGV